MDILSSLKLPQEADPDDATRAWRAGDSPAAATVVVTATDADQETLTATTQLVVVAVDRIVPDNTALLHPVESGHADNAVTGVSADPSTVTVVAQVTPSTPDVSAVYDKLLVWLGDGDAGATADTRVLDRAAPGKQTVSVRCGASREALAVWAVRANVILAGKTEANETSDDPDVITKIPCNTDDDDRDQLPDAQESNGALGFGVPGEDDLTPLILALAPDDLPFGEVRLVLPTSSDFAICAAEDKSDGRLTTTTWDLAAGASPRAVYLEATNISTSAQSLTWQYRIGETTLSEDVVVAKGVAALSADAPRAKLRIVPTHTAYSASIGAVAQPSRALSFAGSPYGAAGLGEYNAVGGDAVGLFYVMLPPHSYVARDIATIEAADLYDPAHLGVAFAVNFNWYDWCVVPDANTIPGEDAPRTCIGWDRRYSDSWDQTVTVCARLYWNTKGSANFEHQISLASVGSCDENGVYDQVRTDRLPIMTQYNGLQNVTPTPIIADVQNVVITSLNETATGNQDYIKYDPTPGSPYEHPQISFTAQDKGDYRGHHFAFTIFIQPIEPSGMERLSEYQAKARLYGSIDLSSGLPTTETPIWWGVTNTYCQLEKGIYMYDVQINEYDEAWNLVDCFAYKWPYCLSVGEHDAWLKFPYGEEPSLKCRYELHDYAWDTTCGPYRERTMKLIAVNGDLDEVASKDGETGINELHDNNGQGILVHKGDDLIGHCFTVFTGEDYCWSSTRRDHAPSRMLAENAGYAPLTPLEAAILANDVYSYVDSINNDVVDGWVNAGLCYANDFTLCIGVYRRTIPDGTNEWAVVNKGTTPLLWEDLYNDIVQPFGVSPDIKDSLKYTEEFVKFHYDDEITFIGHSKGGAEAAANALQLDRNCITFNPAPLNPSPYKLNWIGYKANMTTYIVDGEILDNVFHTRIMPWFGERVVLPGGLINILQDPLLDPVNIVAINNHLMGSVIAGLKREGIQ